MRLSHNSRVLAACFLCFVAVSSAQESQSANTLSGVPKLVHFAGSFRSPVNPPAGPIGATFAIYSEQEGGTPLWSEDRNIELDAGGNYTVLLGATKNRGVPAELFAGGEARWLQVKFYVPGEVDLPRVLLVSVPYALKAGDADTLGGKPAAAYMLAGSTTSAQPAGPSGGAQTAQPEAPVPVRTEAGVRPSFTTGTTNFIPRFTDASGDVGNSVMYQNGSNVGVGTTLAAISMDIRPTATSLYAQLGVAQTVDYMTLFASDTLGPAFYWDPTKALRFGKGGTGLYNAAGFTEFMRIQPSGYVGIGTQTPATTLEVNGNAQVDGGSILASGSVPVIQFPNNGTGNFSAGPGALQALTSTTGPSNTAVGSGALRSDAGGSFNTATGYDALSSNTTGGYNAAFGNQALSFNTTGSANTAVGDNAMLQNTVGSYNTASGFGALSGNTAGSYNAAFGENALLSNTTGQDNSALGALALQYNTSGSFNTAIGEAALGDNTAGYANTANGEGALGHNVTGDSNTAFGVGALFSNIAGNNNTTLGAYALQNTLGGNNVAVGYGAGLNIAGSNNIDIGNQGAAADSGAVRIGTACPNTLSCQTSTYIAGIAGVTLPTANSPLVCIDLSTGQLGTANCALRGAAAEQQEVIGRQQRQIQAQAQEIIELQQRLSRLESLVANK